jgi:hypothetical protein
MTDTAAPAPTPDAAMIEFVNPLQLKKDINIDITDLGGDMQKHAALYVEYAVNSVRARRQFERYKLAQEILESQLDSQHRAELKETNSKTTEKEILAAVVTDPRYKAAGARVIDAQQIFRLAEISERAFDSRKDMLLQIARDAGREANGQLRVVANQTNTDRLSDAMARNAALAA